MRRLILIFGFFIFAFSSHAQVSAGNSKTTTAFDTFAPAEILMKNGQIVRTKQANIFLKNSSLLFKRGNVNMEADMDNILTVDLQGRHYVKVDTLLAYVVDTIGQSRLLCATTIDMESYITQVQNNRQITNLEMVNMVNVTTMDLSSDEDRTFPIVNNYFFEVGGQFIHADERSLMRKMPKSKRRDLKIIMSMPEFSWGNAESLMEILKIM